MQTFRFTIVSVLLISLRVWGAPYLLATEKADLPKAARNSVQLDQGTSKAQCTGTIVSNKGHILTAAHCVASCFSAKPTLISALLPSGKLEKTLMDLNPQAADKCQFLEKVFDKSGQLSGVKVWPAEIIAIGTTHFIDSNRLLRLGLDNIEDFHFLIAAGFSAPTNQGDFAIIKSNEKKGPNCAKSLSRRPFVNEKVWTNSFPKFTRNDKKSLEAAYFSEGVVTNGIRDLIPDENPYKEKYLKMEGPATFLSSVDGEGSSSGAGIFNMNGEVLGVLVSAMKPPDQYVEGSTKSVSIAWIKAELTKRLGRQAVDEIFDCQSYSNFGHSDQI